MPCIVRRDFNVAVDDDSFLELQRRYTAHARGNILGGVEVGVCSPVDKYFSEQRRQRVQDRMASGASASTWGYGLLVVTLAQRWDPSGGPCQM